MNENDMVPFSSLLEMKRELVKVKQEVRNHERASLRWYAVAQIHLQARQELTKSRIIVGFYAFVIGTGFGTVWTLFLQRIFQ